MATVDERVARGHSAHDDRGGRRHPARRAAYALTRSQPSSGGTAARTIPPIPRGLCVGSGASRAAPFEVGPTTPREPDHPALSPGAPHVILDVGPSMHVIKPVAKYWQVNDAD